MKMETVQHHLARIFLSRNFRRAAARSFAVAMLAALVLAAFLLPAAGRAGTPEWLLFIGRFHPLVLHLPIGLLVLLPVLHLLARVSPAGSLRPAVAAVLWLFAGSALVAAMCGLLLSQEGGYAEATLALHRRLALGLTVLAALLLVCESESGDAPTRRAVFARRAYRTLLPLELVCLGVAAHLGATLTHGSTFLTEHLPRPLKAWMGADASPALSKAALPQSTYATLIAPIFTARCTACHGAEKAKGGLRLNTLESILAGGDRQRDEHEPAVIPGHAGESLLIRAVCLPADDDAHMPPTGKSQLTAAEIATLSRWIDAGADAPAPASKGTPPTLVNKTTPGSPRL